MRIPFASELKHFSKRWEYLHCSAAFYEAVNTKKASDKFYRTLWLWLYCAYLKYGTPRNNTLRPVCKIEA